VQHVATVTVALFPHSSITRQLGLICFAGFAPALSRRGARRWLCAPLGTR